MATKASRYTIVKGDRVKVIRGNFRDMEGTVLRVLRDARRVVVEGVNMRKRHERPSETNPEGGIMTFEAPIHISNVMLVDPASDKASRGPHADRGRWNQREDRREDRQSDPQAVAGAVDSHRIDVHCGAT